MYNLSMRWMHWVVGLLMIVLLVVGFWMANFIADDAAYKWEVYGLHKAFGVIAGGLVFLRLLNRLRSAIPSAPKEINALERMLGHLGHWALYGAMVVMPVSGFIMSQAGGHPVKLFGWQLPTVFEKNEELGGLAHELHEYVAIIFAVMLVGHVLAVVKHRYVDGVSLLPRMRLSK